MTGLSRRALGRATLARQLLLERSTLSVLDVVEELVGLPAQDPHSWYVGLWSRVADVRPETISYLLESRQLVRLALLRSSLHLVTAEDAAAIRPLLDPVLRQSLNGVSEDLTGLDLDEVARVGRDLVEATPMALDELGRAMTSRWHDRDPASLAQVVRAREALVQVPPRGLWQRAGQERHTTLQTWLGRDLGPGMSIQALVMRYLRAFGPASVEDAQTWSGLPRLAPVLEDLRQQLLVLQDEDGRELFDLPDALRPGPDVPAPVRLLYEGDDLLLAHADRSRFLTDAARAHHVAPGERAPRWVLVDGVAAGVWTHRRSEARSTVTVTPFERLDAETVAACEAEAASLLRFLDADLDDHDVRVRDRP